jgi:hypothetical protein
MKKLRKLFFPTNRYTKWHLIADITILVGITLLLSYLILS